MENLSEPETRPVQTAALRAPSAGLNSAGSPYVEPAAVVSSKLIGPVSKMGPSQGGPSPPPSPPASAVLLVHCSFCCCISPWRSGVTSSHCVSSALNSFSQAVSPVTGTGLYQLPPPSFELLSLWASVLILDPFWVQSINFPPLVFLALLHSSVWERLFLYHLPKILLIQFFKTEKIFFLCSKYVSLLLFTFFFNHG